MLQRALQKLEPKGEKIQSSFKTLPLFKYSQKEAMSGQLSWVYSREMAKEMFFKTFTDLNY